MPSGPSWLVELRYGRNHIGSIPRWSPSLVKPGFGGFLSREKISSS
jgi:hypothetical protein